MGHAGGVKVVDDRDYFVGDRVERTDVRGYNGSGRETMAPKETKFEISGRILRQMIVDAARANQSQATTISFDGPNRAGKNGTIGNLRMWLAGEYPGLFTFVFKDSEFGDLDAVSAWRDYRRRYGRNGNPKEAAKLSSRVRRTALDTPQVQDALANPRCVFLAQRSALDSIVYRLVDSLDPQKREGRTPPTFMNDMLGIMRGSYMIPDLVVLLDLDYPTMLARMVASGSSDASGELPSPAYNEAYRFLARGNYGRGRKAGRRSVVPNRVTIDATEPLGAVHDKVRSVVRKLLIKKGLIPRT